MRSGLVGVTTSILLRQQASIGKRSFQKGNNIFQGNGQATKPEGRAHSK